MDSGTIDLDALGPLMDACGSDVIGVFATGNVPPDIPSPHTVVLGSTESA